MVSSGLFIAGTDTGVGKTVVAAGLVRTARKQGLRCLPVKPVETGCRVQSGSLYPEDGAFLVKAAENDITLDACAPFRFSLPAAPARAAAMEGTRLRFSDLVEHIRTVAEDADFTVVEAAGGLMVPLEEALMVLDLAVELGYPTLLVARSKLGTINHTLLSVHALRSRGIEPAGIVLSATCGDVGPEEEFTAHDIARLVGTVPVVTLPRLSPEVASDPEAIAQAMSEHWSEGVIGRWLGKV